jgi:hypothetical protein
MVCISIFFSTLIGCKGDSGPIGPTGTKGNANVNMYVFSFNASDLIMGSSDSTYYYISFLDSTIARTIHSGAAALLYLESDSLWNPLPYTEPHEPTLSIAYYFKNQSLYIEVITSHGDARSRLISFLNGDIYQLRLIVIPANNTYLAKLVIGKSSYNELKTIFYLQN